MNPTKHHLTLKENITTQMQEVIDFALKGKEKELEEFMENREANTPKKKMQYTADFIEQSTPDFGKNFPYINSEMYYCEFTNGNFKCNMPPFYVTNMHYAINKDWGNGKGKPICTIKNRNATAKSMQMGVMEMRSEVLNDEEKREWFLSWLEENSHKKSHPWYCCRKFILNRSNTEGIHLPYTEPPKATFTPYSSTNPKPEESHKPQATSHKPKKEESHKPQTASCKPQAPGTYPKTILYEAA